MTTKDQELHGPGTASEEATEPEGSDFWDACDQYSGDQDAIVRIERYDDRDRVHLQNWALSEFDIDSVAETFGGGKYFFRIRLPTGWLKGGSTVVRIAGEPKDPRKKPEKPAEPEAREPNAVEKLAEQVGTLATRFDEELKTLRDPHPTFQQQDPVTLFSSMLGAVQALTDPMREQVRDLLSRDRDSERDRFSDFLRGLQLGQKLTGPRDGGGVDSVLDRYLPILERAMGSGGGGAGAPGAPAPGNPPAATPTPSLVDRSKLPATGGPPPRWLDFLPQYLPRLYRLAALGRTPGTYAEVLLDEIPEDAYGEIYAELARPGFRDEIYSAARGAAEHREWLDSFFDAALWSLDPGPDDSAPKTE